jgi:hypothetical protein
MYKNNIIYILVLLLFIIYYNYSFYNLKKEIMKKQNKETFNNTEYINISKIDNCSILQHKVLKLEEEINASNCNNIQLKKNYLNNRDKKIYYDEFTAPERRVPEYIYPYPAHNINIPTRGYPDNYQQIGIIYNDNNTFNLFGRQKYPGSNQYEYYISGTSNNTHIKLPIYTKGTREIENDQEIYVDIGNNKKFKTKLYNFDTPRYDPFVI